MSIARGFSSSKVGLKVVPFNLSVGLEGPWPGVRGVFCRVGVDSTSVNGDVVGLLLGSGAW